MNTLNYVDLEGRPIRIQWSQRDPSYRRSAIGNTFIKNLALDIEAASLLDLFGPFGKISSCKVQLDSDGQSLGYGFIQFESDEVAKRAIESMNGKLLNNKMM